MSENDTTDDTKTGPIEERLCPYFTRKATWSVPCLTVNRMAWDRLFRKCRIIEQSGIVETLHRLIEATNNKP